MARFFINRPIVAMVISIIMVILGIIAMVQLPIAQFPDLAPPEIMLQATYVGADAVTLEKSVATPIEQMMSGVDNMIYMYSVNANNGQMSLRVDFDINTRPNDDQILTQMRYSQAESQLPSDVKNLGVTIKKSTTSPLALFSLYSPNGTYDATFLANYGYVNINDPMTRVPGIGQVQIFGAGQYAMRFWVRPDQLAKLGITVTEILNAIKAQNTVNPAGQIGAEPAPTGQEFTYSVRAQGRLETEEEFGNIVIRANQDGSMVRLKDVARTELGSQMYNMIGRMNGKPAALIAIYQLPGSNAIQTMDAAKKLMDEMKERFPADLDYVTSLDTTQAVREGIKEIVHTLFEALVLVIIVVYIFLQGWRATLIPLLAVPVSLIGVFVLFPLLGFSINTLSLFGLVLAIGLVVDDAIVVVEAVEHHIAHGMSPKEASFKAMEEVSGPVVAIALILVAVFIPTAFIPGITGRLYQQFAVTIALSVVISAFNALTLSPALAALLLRPKRPSRGPLGWFFGWFNRGFDACDGRLCEGLWPFDSQGRALDAFFGCGHGRLGLARDATAGRLPPDRRSGLCVFERPAAERLVAATHGRSLQKDRGHPEKHAGRAICQHGRRVQPAEHSEHHLQRILFRDARALGRTHEARGKTPADFREGQRAARRVARGESLSLSATRHSRRRHVRRRDLHSGRSRWGRISNSSRRARKSLWMRPASVRRSHGSIRRSFPTFPKYLPGWIAKKC